MPTVPLPPGPFPSSDVVRALHMKQSTIGTWAERGMFDAFDHTGGVRGRMRMLTLRDALACALLWQKHMGGVDAPEFDAPAAHRFADMWLRTRDSSKPVREVVLRYYGVPDRADSKVSILINEDLLPNAPEPGARLTMHFDLDAIFEPLIAALAEAT
ncbi:hypothetical protein [Roseomonas sp. BN140053]|uniref:hypothetical protein n=1 Tax=Roseomonas sp. BN140053 TaxID=3391898 RepID=UPI0039ED2805